MHQRLLYIVSRVNQVELRSFTKYNGNKYHLISFCNYNRNDILISYNNGLFLRSALIGFVHEILTNVYCEFNYILGIYCLLSVCVGQSTN